jgi:hypoxanthine phosphoribosyltransferase
VTGPAFAHASEAELARILEYYQVHWEYEPRSFPILWNLDGKVVESFTPDFYLPELDLFIELTTLKQSLVRKKNRKLRRLRELYPDIRIKLFYAKDFKALMLKYGRIDLVASLSGPEGQARAPQLDGGDLEDLDRPLAAVPMAPPARAVAKERAAPADLPVAGEASPSGTRRSGEGESPLSGTGPAARRARRRARRRVVRMSERP